MTISKEDYDLTRRTPTPPAQRDHRQRFRQRQLQRERHQAVVRGQFDVKKKRVSVKQRTVDDYLNDQRTLQAQQQLQRYQTQQQNKKKMEEFERLNPMQQQQQHAGGFGGAGSSNLSFSGNLQDAGNLSFLQDKPIENDSMFAPSAAHLQKMSFLPFQVPPVSNDSFSTFFNAGSGAGEGGGGRPISSSQSQQQQQPQSQQDFFQASDPASIAAAAVAEADRRGHSHSHHEHQQHEHHHHHHHHHHQHHSHHEQGEHREFAGDIPLQFEHTSMEDMVEEEMKRNEHLANLKPPCGFDTLDDPHDLFLNEKRISGEDHFEKYNFAMEADQIRVAATVREFRKLVVDPKSKNHDHNNNNNATTTSHGMRPFTAPRKPGLSSKKQTSFASPVSRGGAGGFTKRKGAGDDNDNSYNRTRGDRDEVDSQRKSSDPKDHQHVIEGLLGTTQKLTSASNCEQEAIRILRSATMQPATSGGLSKENNALTHRLAHGIEEQKRHQQHHSQSPHHHHHHHHHHHSPQGSGRPGSTASSAYSSSSPHRSASSMIKPAANCVPRPPTAYSQVGSRARREADSFENQVLRRAEEIRNEKAKKQQHEEERLRQLHLERGEQAGGIVGKKDAKNNVEARPPFRLKGPDLAGGSKLTQHDHQLEHDIADDIRFFEWRRSAQQHATNQAKVAIAREKQLENFRTRQAEHFRSALSRYEPGALQRAEKAIQHRIAHELVSKYGPSAFMVSSASSSSSSVPAGSNSDRDIAIPLSFQVCAREAALAAADQARSEAARKKLREQRRVEQELETAGFQLQQEKDLEKSLKLSQSARRSSSSSSSTVNTNTNNNSASSSSSNTARRQSTAPSSPSVRSGSYDSLPRSTRVAVATHRRVTEGLPVPKKEYVHKSAIAASGYAKWSGDVLPKARSACQTDENDEFMSGAKTVKSEIEALEARAPGLQLDKRKTLTRKNSLTANTAPQVKDPSSPLLL